MKFYILDLGLYSSDDDFAELSVEVDADRASRAAEDWASRLDDTHDGMTAECLVSESRDGKDAERYRVKARVEWTYDARLVRD